MSNHNPLSDARGCFHIAPLALNTYSAAADLKLMKKSISPRRPTILLFRRARCRCQLPALQWLRKCFGYFVKRSSLQNHQRMGQCWNGLVDPNWHARARCRDNDQIQWRPQRGDFYFAQSRPIFVKLSQKIAAGPHFFARDASIQEREQGAMIGCRHGNEAIDSRIPSHHLNIIAAN